MVRRLQSSCWFQVIGVGFALAHAVPSSAAVITVGAGGGYDFTSISAAVAAASANDNIQVAAGTYLNDFATINVPLTIEAVGGTAVLEANILIPNGKAFFVTNAATTIRNLEFRHARVTDGNGAGIRAQSGNLFIENTTFRDNEDGILTASNPGMSITVVNSTFIDNGAGDGLTHAIYANHIDTLSVINSTFSGTKIGHDIKSRAANTFITGNTLDDGVNGTPSYAIDLPNGGVAVVTGNTITQGPNTDNPTMIAFGAEGSLKVISSLLVHNNAFINTLPTGSVGVFNHTAIAVTLEDNVFNGVAQPLVGPGMVTNTSAPAPGAIFSLGLACLGLAILRRARAQRPA